MSRFAVTSWRLFTQTLTCFLLLGVAPILLIAIVFALPVEWQLVQYKTLIGLLLILATISTLCLTGVVTRLLKHPINQLVQAQKVLQGGDLCARLPATGNQEIQILFHGFNQMAEGLQVASEREKELVETRAFSTLAAQVVHDLRSPLTSLRVVATHFDAAPSADPRQAELVKLLTLGVARLQSIADELLLERKRREGPKVTEIHEALAELVEEVKQRRLNGLTVTTEWHSGPLHIPVTKIDLQRAIGNIVTNAIEAMHGAGTIRITTASDTTGIRIAIEDTGPGMAPDILAKVLQGGFTHGKAGGNGVGMTVVRAIVETAGGQLRAHSVIGQGTTFLLQFPLIAQ